MKTTSKLKIIPLGGLGEIGRNMTILEYEEKIIIIDIGLGFPELDMPGIDFTIPNTKYLEDKQDKILGVFFTHGHYDHIGAVPYLIDKIGNPPLFASPLTTAIIKKRQTDFPNAPKLNIKSIKEDEVIKFYPFEVSFFRVNHNIPDDFAIKVDTPIGAIIYTSDFKFDPDPVNEKPTDLEQLKSIGDKGVLVLMEDSTGAEEEGHSISEKVIKDNLEIIFKQAKGRIIAATFGSLLNRVQQLISLSEAYNRKVIIQGFTMKSNVEICKELGYIKAEKYTFIEAKDMHRYSDDKLTVIGTGAQGESNAFLMRYANGEHKEVQLKKGDTIIFSSSVVPGNERSVQALKDNLYKRGTHVFHYKMMDIHASGHGEREDLREMLRLLRPKFLMPTHGYLSMMARHAELGEEVLHMPKENIALAENGQIVEVTPDKIIVTKNTVDSNIIMVDGLGVGDVGEVVLRDRQLMSADGMFVIIAVVDSQTGKVKGEPDIISRGFIYMKESKDLLRQTRKKIKETIARTVIPGTDINWPYIRNSLRDNIGKFLYSKTRRRPMILPVIVEI
ncbi:MAG: ribonuclease J [Candidatus Azambacteria bacterium]|nr:ribonuclease J [Candidatus Azambacteria bacterium]